MSGVSTSSPKVRAARSSSHDLRHRRISLLHLRGVPVGEDRRASRPAEPGRDREHTYTHVLTDERELDYEMMLAVSKSRPANALASA
jgi:hypothetical protein